MSVHKMGRHTCYDNLTSHDRLGVACDMMEWMGFGDLKDLADYVENEIKKRTAIVLEMRKRNHNRRIRRYKKRVRLLEESENVSENSEHTDDGWVSGCDEQSSDGSYEDVEYAAVVMKEEAT